MRILTKAVITLMSGAALATTPALAQDTTATQSQTGTPAPIPAQPTPAATATVAQVISQAPEYSTLQRLIVAANQTAALSGPGPITVFAPDDAAFGRLAPGTIDQLLNPERQWSAEQIVKYHVVQGKYTTDDLLKQLKTTPTLTLNTLDGQPLTLSMVGESAIQLTDAMGNKAFIAKRSDDASNGAVEYINGVLSPKMLPKPVPNAAAAPDAATPETTTPDTTTAPDTGSDEGGDQDDGTTGA
jgi:uncharacterized surface protein with fasciclin (FAS1) repeats